MGLWLEVAIDKSAHKIKIVGSYRNARGIKEKDAHISEHPQGTSQNLNLTNSAISAIMITSERETRGSKFTKFRENLTET